MKNAPDINNTAICSRSFICRCLKITEADLVEALAIREIKTIRDIIRHTGAGDGCTACHRLLERYLR